MLSCSGEGLYPGIAGALGCPRGCLDLSESILRSVMVPQHVPIHQRQVVKEEKEPRLVLQAWYDKTDMLPGSPR